MRKSNSPIPGVRRSLRDASNGPVWSATVRRTATALVAAIVGALMGFGARWLGPPYAGLAWLHGVLGALGAAVFMLFFAEALWRR